MAIKSVDWEKVFRKLYPYAPYKPELSSDELSKLNREIEKEMGIERNTTEDPPLDALNLQLDENDQQVIFENQCHDALEDLRLHLLEKNKA